MTYGGEGYPTFTPSGGFAIPRSYFRYVRVHHYHTAYLTLDPVTLLIRYTDAPGFALHIVFREGFLIWNSNAYTLDHVLTAVYYDYPPISIHIPYTCTLGWEFDPAYHQDVLTVATDSPEVFTYLDAGSPPREYWIPVPL